MSLTLPDARHQQIVEDAARASSEETLNARPILMIGGVDMTRFFENGNWVQGPDEYPITLEATLGAVLPDRYQGESVQLYVEVEGVIVEQMLAPPALSKIKVGEDKESTELLAGTGSVYLERQSLQERVPYQGVTPNVILLDAVRRGNVHDLSQVEIEPVAGPAITWDYRPSGDEAFKFTDRIADILYRVDALGNESEFQAQARLLSRDTARNGFVSRLKRGYREQAGMRVYDWRDMHWVPPERKTELFSHVGVYRLLDNGEPAYKEIVPVEYRGRGVPPREGTIMWIALGDDSSAGPDRARQRAYDAAEGLASGEYEGQQELPVFDGLLEKGDPFMVLEVFRDEEATWDRAWLCEVTGFTKPFDKVLGVGPPVVEYEGILLHDEEIKVPTFIGPPPSTGGVAVPMAPPMSLGVDGFVINTDVMGEEIYADLEDGELWIDEDLANGRAGFDEEDGLWFED